MSSAGAPMEKPRVSPIHDPRVRGFVYQAVLLVVLGGLVWEAATNAAENMRARGIPTNFDFWNRTAGFDINQTLISYSAVSTYGQAFWVGLLNTLLVAAIGVVLATLLGFTLGIARLSSNWLVARLATLYLETVRNVPLLLQLLFWYNAVLKPLPGPRQSLALPGIGLAVPGIATLAVGVLAVLAGLGLRRLRGGAGLATMLGTTLAPLLVGAGLLVLLLGPGTFGLPGGQGILVARGSMGIFLNNRGLILPEPVAGAGFGWAELALAAGILLAVAYALWARREQQRSGAQKPVAAVAALLVVGLPLAAFLAAGRPLDVAYGTLRGFNFDGGLRVLPEFVALILGLTLYTAAFIGEIVRAGIRSVAHGQTEAAHALGLRGGPTLRLVVIPQAMRVIVPPLTNQYLNLTKNSSLAVFIGYPDLVQVFAGTVLNQTGAAVQVISITMGVYLLISLVTSGLMDLFNRRMALRER
jgi:general L-amino acid transport system permease protein